MTHSKNSTELPLIHKVTGVLLILFAILDLYYFFDGLIGVKELMRQQQDKYNYTVDDFKWTSIIWKKHTILLAFLLFLTAGIGILKNWKIGWIIGVPTTLVFIFGGILLMRLPYYDTMQIEFDERWFKLFFKSFLMLIALINMLHPKFWRYAAISWKELLLAFLFFLLLFFYDPTINIVFLRTLEN